MKQRKWLGACVLVAVAVFALTAAGMAGEEVPAAAEAAVEAAAETAETAETAEEPDPLAVLRGDADMVWTCIAAFLVFFMQAGFAMVEAGFTRAKNACNIIMKNVMDFSIGTMAWFLIGFGLMFGGGESTWAGGTHLWGADISGDIGLGWSFWIFQCVFAGTAATIVSGAMAGRTKFTGYLAYSAVICGLIYPISGHWAWGSLSGLGEGWLEQKSFIDFAGSTVVHSCGAWLALAGAITLGPRLGKYGPDGGSRAIPGHNIPIAALGVFILWFGWFGFNPGSTTAIGADVGFIAVTTNIAAACGAIAAMITSWWRFRKPDVSMTLNGVLAGLVAITAPCANVLPGHAAIIGLLAGALVVLSVEFIDKVLKIDDPVGAVSVHGVCGAFGTIMAGVFNTPGTPGYVEGGSVGTQLIGVVAMFVWAFVTGMVLFNIIKYTIGLRVEPEEEMRGLDIGEHGNEAYAGFQIFRTM